MTRGIGPLPVFCKFLEKDFYIFKNLFLKSRRRIYHREDCGPQSLKYCLALKILSSPHQPGIKLSRWAPTVFFAIKVNEVLSDLVVISTLAFSPLFLLAFSHLCKLIWA